MTDPDSGRRRIASALIAGFVPQRMSSPVAKIEAKMARMCPLVSLQALTDAGLGLDDHLLRSIERYGRFDEPPRVVEVGSGTGQATRGLGQHVCMGDEGKRERRQLDL